MEIDLKEGESAVFVGIKMTDDGVECSVFNMDFTTDAKRACSILALGAATSVINDAENIEKRGVEEFLGFTKSLCSKEYDDSEEELYGMSADDIFNGLKDLGKPDKEKITRKDNVINISELLKDRKDK
tara:strand:+ start:2882 stop:3265 length:384 start_codon:yes stop_codon:yes gene_type:complete